MVDFNPGELHANVVPIILKKGDAVSIFESIHNNRPIAPPPGGWSTMSMLTLAGAAMAAAQAQGPKQWDLMFSKEQRELVDLPDEERKEVLHSLFRFIQAGSIAAANFFYAIVSKNWDQRFEEEVGIVVTDSGQTHIIKGGKSDP